MKYVVVRYLIAGSLFLLPLSVQAALLCNDCHGIKETMDLRPVDHSYRNITTGGFKGNHQPHMSMSSGASVAACTGCHGAAAAEYTSSHRNGTIEMSANINDSPAAGGASYSRPSPFPQSSTPILGTCSNVNCHFETGTPTWGTAEFSAPGDCSKCHGAPPASGSHPVSNSKHGTYLGTDISSCIKCHPNHLADSRPFAHATSVGKRNLAVQFQSQHAAGVYTGATNDYLPSQQNSFGSCSNTYCHSNGTSVSTGTIQANTSVKWGTVGQGCNGCHGFPPAYSNGSPKKNNHSRHNFVCNTCHSTVTDGTSIIDPSLHVNGGYTVVKGNTADFSYTYNAQGGTCNGISCHGGNNATWGSTLRCQDCHLSTIDTENFVYGDKVSAKIKNIGEWDATGHGKASGAYSSLNNAAGFTTSNACLYCHETGINHGDSANQFRLKNITDSTWGKNGVCMNCHAESSLGVTIDSTFKNGGKKVSATHYDLSTDHTSARNGGQFCWDCHDPHGDGNIFMIHNKVAKTSFSGTGVPDVTVPVVFTSFATGTDYAGAGTKLCNACHSTVSHYAGSSSDGHNSDKRCTSCHSHNGSTKFSAFAGGESQGGLQCASCHNDLFDSNVARYSMHDQTAGINYKHYMDNDKPGYSYLLPDGPSQNVTSRSCTMCHVDHNVFSVVTDNKSKGRGYNLRTYANVSSAQIPKSLPTNTDLTLCTSCHYQVSTKFITAPGKESTTVSVPYSGISFKNATTLVKSSTHGYKVSSQPFVDSGKGNTDFQANCTKCHNDSIGKNGANGEGNKSGMNGQDGTTAGLYKFGNHQSTVNNMFSVMSTKFYQGRVNTATTSTLTVAGTPWTTDEWAGFDVVITSGTGANQRAKIIGNSSNALTVALNFFPVPNGTSTFDIAQAPTVTDNICFSCHSKNGQKKFNGQGLDWYGQEPMKPSLEGIRDLFISDSGTTTANSTTSPSTIIDADKSWATNAWAGYSVRFTSSELRGQVRKIQSNTGNTLTLELTRRLRKNVMTGTGYEIFKPATHPMDNYGRHKTNERIEPTREWNKGDTGNDTNLTGPTSNATSLTDTTKYWSSSQWVGMTVTFPDRGITRTITANSTTSISFASVPTLDVGEPYYIGNRHVSCTDCHNSHAALDHPEGVVNSFSNTAPYTLTSAAVINPRWVVDQWKGYLLIVRQFTGSTDNGKEQVRYITGFNPTSGTFTVSLPWNTAMFSIDSDDHFEVQTGTQWTPSGQDGGRAGEGSSGAWGMSISNWSTPAAGSLQDTSTLTFTKIENIYDRSGAIGGSSSSGQRDMCVRCHSSYAYGNALPTTPTPGPYPGGSAPSSSGPTPSTDVAAEFNPNNASHHAVYARGKNQPIKANYGNSSSSYAGYYNPNWPKYSTTNSAHTISLANGTATLNGGAQLPGTAIPGWLLYIGADSITAASTPITGSGSTTSGTGFLEITSITSPTSFTVRAINSSDAWVTNCSLPTATANWFITAGLGNSFVPPFGPWSILRCTDCHGSTKTDPLGPHASANDWLLKSIDTMLSFEWYNGTAVNVVTPNSSINMGTNEKNIFCYNCHRRDVYHNNQYKTSPNSSQSKVDHNELICVGNGLVVEPSNWMPVGWQNWCRHCHGGDKVGGMHGTNITFTSGRTQTTGVKKRFLNGASWAGYGLSDTSNPVTCYTISGGNSVSSCSGNHNGNKNSGSNAFYSYW